MAKVIICLILTVVFSFLGYTSFMSHDYKPLKDWMAYYTEYKAVRQMLSSGTADKAQILERLKSMYPEHAREIEAKFQEKYGSIKNMAEDSQENAQTSLSDTLSQLKKESAERLREQEETTVQPAPLTRQSRSDSSRAAASAEQKDDSQTAADTKKPRKNP